MQNKHKIQNFSQLKFFQSNHSLFDFCLCVWFLTDVVRHFKVRWKKLLVRNSCLELNDRSTCLKQPKQHPPHHYHCHHPHPPKKNQTKTPNQTYQPEMSRSFHPVSHSLSRSSLAWKRSGGKLKCSFSKKYHSISRSPSPRPHTPWVFFDRKKKCSTLFLSRSMWHLSEFPGEHKDDYRSFAISKNQLLELALHWNCWNPSQLKAAAAQSFRRKTSKPKPICGAFLKSNSLNSCIQCLSQ